MRYLNRSIWFDHSGEWSNWMEGIPSEAVQSILDNNETLSVVRLSFDDCTIEWRKG